MTHRIEIKHRSVDECAVVRARFACVVPGCLAGKVKGGRAQIDALMALLATHHAYTEETT